MTRRLALLVLVAVLATAATGALLISRERARTEPEVARDQERARGGGRQDGDEHQERQPARHRYSAAFST